MNRSSMYNKLHPAGPLPHWFLLSSLGREWGEQGVQHNTSFVFSLMVVISFSIFIFAPKSRCDPPGGIQLPKNVKKTLWQWFKGYWIFLKICILSNLTVLNSFLTLFWSQKVVLTLLGHLKPQNVKNLPYHKDFENLSDNPQSCFLSNLIVVNSFL